MILAILMLFSMLTALLGQRAANPLRSAIRLVLVPPGDGAMYLATQFKEGGKPTGTDLTPKQIQRLQKENEVLCQMIYGVAKDRDKWRRRATIVEGVRARFGGATDFPYDLIPARVVAVDSLPYGTGRVLGTGRSKGAVDGAPVTTRGLQIDRPKALLKGSAGIAWPQNLMTVTSARLVGRISQAGEYTASLQLVTDAGFSMNAVIRRKRDGRPFNVTPVTGDGKESLIVTVPEAHGIRPGDTLVSRADERFLPAEIGIGKVVVVEPDPDRPGFSKLVVKPDADLAALREVFIVVHRGKSIPAATEGKR